MNHRKKRNRRIDADLLEAEFFDELGYQEIDQLYDKVIELFDNKSYKTFYKPDFVKLVKLIAHQCSYQAEAEHDIRESNIHYKKMKRLSEIGLQLSKKDEELLHNLKIVKRVFEERIYS